MKPLFDRRWIVRGLTIALAVLAFAAAPVSAGAFKFKRLHSFCKLVQCGDGQLPTETLTLDAAGNLYGTAAGGAHGQGLVFKLTAPAGHGPWKYDILYHFCARPNCVDGRDPTASRLIVDTAGNVYGTTFGGGEGSDTGTVFELSPAGGRQWTLHTLYSFCAGSSSCSDGENPDGGLTYAGREQGQPYDGTSPLYGTASHGGRYFGGVAYALIRRATGEWREANLYAFCKHGVQPCRDGALPLQQLTMDPGGNLYGTTLIGGTNDRGVAFKLSANSKPVTETVLYSFCNSCRVHSGLTIDSAGNLFGSSWQSDKVDNCPDFGGCGFIFRIGAERTASIVYNFCQLANCTDGWGPDDFGGFAVDSAGNVYGTTDLGGLNGSGGVVFRLSGTHLQVLHNLCASSEGCIRAFNSHGGLVRNAAGQLFGVTDQGGRYENEGIGGTVFELTR